jgi:hypothetical protein
MHPLDIVHPTLRPLVSAFLLKSKYPYTLEVGGRTVSIPVEDGEDQYGTFSMRVNFFDPNYTHSSVGSVRLIVKKDASLTYGVMGRKEVAPRRRTTEDRYTKTSTDTKKVLKMMRHMITPYTLQEISGYYDNRIGEAILPWKTELYSKTRVPYQRLTYDTMVKELRNLQSLGVNFVTSEFRGMMEETLAYHDEYEYRNTTPIIKMFVSIREDGVHTMADGQLAIYSTFDSLPKDTQGRLAILKMLKDGDNIPEVGIRIDAKTFWVLIMPERVDAGNK